MSLPDNCDAEKIAEAAMALLFLTFHDESEGVRAWKGMDWDVMNLLHEKGWISNPKSKAKSVLVTEEGVRQAERLFEEFFQSKR